MGIFQPGLTQRVGMGWRCLEVSLSDCNLKYQSIPVVCTAQWKQLGACFMCPYLSKHHLITAMGKSIYKGFSSKPCLITQEGIWCHRYMTENHLSSQQPESPAEHDTRIGAEWKITSGHGSVQREQHPCLLENQHATLRGRQAAFYPNSAILAEQPSF